MKKNRDFLTWIISKGVVVAWWIINVHIEEIKDDHEEVYRKWLGPEYKMSFDQDFSILLANHQSLFEVVYLCGKFAPGFVAKSSLINIPFIGYIGIVLESLWIDRSEKESREKALHKIIQRQKDVMDKKVLTPLIVFPEGTCTDGNHILKFKRGAFEALLPVKCILFNSIKHEVAESTVMTELQMIMDYCRLNHHFKIIELPVIYPTSFMYENYQNQFPQVKEKAEIYANVVREIWTEIGGFKQSNKGFSNYLEYAGLVNGKIMKSD